MVDTQMKSLKNIMARKYGRNVWKSWNNTIVDTAFHKGKELNYNRHRIMLQTEFGDATIQFGRKLHNNITSYQGQEGQEGARLHQN